MKTKPFVFLALILLLSVITACGGSVDETTTSSLPSSPPDRVEVNYFYAPAGACLCLRLATEWIDTTITTDYKNQLDSGKLTYNRYDTKDPANSAVMAEFYATSYSLYITVVRGSDKSTHMVSGIWLYMDHTGKDEIIKSKFIDLLKSELDKALAGG